MRIIAPLLFLGACLPVLADERALLIGIGRYAEPGHDLPGIDLDISAQEATMRDFGFRPGQIRILKDNQATEANIRSGIQTWLTQGVKPDDRVIFYYSGHGSLANDKTGNPIGFLVPHDITVRNGVVQHALFGPELRALIETIPSRHVLVIIDSCHSGNLTDRSKSLDDEVVPKFFRYPGMPAGDAELMEESHSKGISTTSGSNHLLLSACQRSQVAGATRHGSVLTVALSEQVKMLLNQGRPVKLKSLEPDIERNVMQMTARKQVPELAGSSILEGYDWSKGIVHDTQPISTPQPQRRPRPPQTPAPAQDWSLLTWAYEQRAGDLSASLNARIFHRNGRMTATVQVPGDGYLNVIALGQGDQTATVLFPNEYQQDNRVTAGTLSLPGSGNYHWEQDLPAKYSAQLNKVLFLFSDKNVNMFKEGTGKEGFRGFSRDSRSTVVKESSGYAAALLDYTIAK